MLINKRIVVVDPWGDNLQMHHQLRDLGRFIEQRRQTRQRFWEAADLQKNCPKQARQYPPSTRPAPAQWASVQAFGFTVLS